MNGGSAMLARTSPVSARSARPPRRSAETRPAPTPSSTHSTAPPSVSDAVTGRAASSSESTDCPVSKE